MLEDGTIVEMVHDVAAARTAYAVGKGSAWSLAEGVESPGGPLRPYSPDNNLLTHGVVALPARPEPFGHELALASRVRDFLHRYVDLAPEFEEVAARYVLFTWQYDDFSEVPYLRVRGDYGTGKSRFLLAAGLLCYRATFASGASSVSSLFRIMDAFRGTVILDEADFRFSDEKAELTKVLNNGHARGFPVLRTEQVATRREFSPRAFTVFGPKIIATRDLFHDVALESRCITEVFLPRPVRADIPLHLDDRFRREALDLRNQLLAYRFAAKGTAACVGASAPGAEARTDQILGPLLATITDDASRQRVALYCRQLAETEKADRQDGRSETIVLEALLALAAGAERVAVKDIAAEVMRRTADEEGWRATPRWVGSILRRKLFLRPVKTHGSFVVPAGELARLPLLATRFGLPRVDMGTLGTSSEPPLSVPREAE